MPDRTECIWHQLLVFFYEQHILKCHRFISGGILGNEIHLHYLFKELFSITIRSDMRLKKMKNSLKTLKNTRRQNSVLFKCV